nr:Uncharacterised protein [Raoultella sp. NCTC 9187]
MRADQRIDAVCAGTDIQNARTLGDRAGIQRQQVGEMVDIIRPSRHRRAQEAIRNVPVFHRVKVRQQRLIQRLHREWVGKVNGLLARRIQGDKTLELGVSQAELGQIITLMVTVTRV